MSLHFAAYRDHFETGLPKGGFSVGQSFSINTERENNVPVHVSRF
jgi:hypothetical protein